MKYGYKELPFAAPFADALVGDPALREWVVCKTKFADQQKPWRLLHEEMKRCRSKIATNWWRSHFTGRCECNGCIGGKETDLLAVFEDAGGYRFALHFEVKQPTDRFKKGGGQAIAYRERAECWVRPDHTPPKVLAHKGAATALVCTRAMLTTAPEDVALFDAIFTFEEVAEQFGVRFPD
jgi:phage/plasmid primase-like uncharacterized protein